MSLSEEDSKFLAEAMGLTWNTIENSWGNEYGPRNIDFTSEHGFFVAFEWAKKQEWWPDFLNENGLGFKLWNEEPSWGLPVDLIGPRFAEELVKFLKGGKVKSPISGAREGD